MEAEKWGLTVEEASGPPCELWPDNVVPVNVFTAMTTQWNVGPGGVVGLNYASLGEVWRRLKVPPDKRDAVFDDLRVMEVEAIKVMREK